MRLHATCRLCNQDFALEDLYDPTAPRRPDHCPRCDQHLGVIGLTRPVETLDIAIDRLLESAKTLAELEPAIRIRTGPTVDELTEVLQRLEHGELSPFAKQRVGLTD